MPASTHMPLNLDGCHSLANALDDHPETVISTYLLHRGWCQAYVAGDPDTFAGAIVQADAFPREPAGFGDDPLVLWDLLQSVEEWDCVLVDMEIAFPLGEILHREMGVAVRYLDDVYHTLNRPVRVFQSVDVRLLGLDDLELLAAAPEALGISHDPRLLLREGFVAGAIVRGEIVAVAQTFASSERYTDVGVATLKEYRRRGYATAAASLVARKIQEGGRTPVWSTGEHNTASLRTAAKLGFTEVSRRRYVILERSG